MANQSTQYEDEFEVELGSDAFDALLDAADGLGPGDTLEHGGFTLTQEAAGYVVEVDGKRHGDLSESELHEIASDYAHPVTDWHFWTTVAGEGTARAAFLRWLEGADGILQDSDGISQGADGISQGADGISQGADGAPEELPDDGGVRTVAERYAALAEGVSREWGQLLVSATLTERGNRTYEIRHADDADVDVATLDQYTDPIEARRLVKFDDDGRYRPLKAAPTLPSGWVFADLSPRDVYETVETIYPATIANWHRECEGRLDVDHWQETMARQTGIYGLIETWDRGEGHEHVDWVAEACCADSQCLKRREWEYNEDTDLDVDGGDGVFPCREPCSLVVSAARKWTKLEAEESRTYEFELTPSEKEQVEAIIDGVADGRVGEIREADIYEGANRFRTRFLRAKRFDEEGHLAGVPTDPGDDVEESDG